jgi:hypothetical protein
MKGGALRSHSHAPHDEGLMIRRFYEKRSAMPTPMTASIARMTLLGRTYLETT